ncbi:MAG: hypothetical protein N2439_12825, partial [Anaerolineae bacterium]|nr:hypothetical protein [Anaerolineae bacterium]
DDRRPAPEGLVPIINPDGSQKADRVWDAVRYRYRLAPPSLAAIDGARFFRWTGQGFEEVSTDVRAGVRAVPSRGWGF